MQDQVAINRWKASWIAGQVKRSQYPQAFWEDIAKLLIDGRQRLKNNPLVPVGRYVFDWPGAVELLLERNNRGIALEKSGNIDAAIVIYEVSVADEFFGTHPLEDD